MLQKSFLYIIPFQSCWTLLAHCHHTLNNVIHRTKGPRQEPNAMTVFPPLFSVFTEIYLIISQRTHGRVGVLVNCSKFFSLQLLKGISCNKWKVTLSPTGFQSLLRVVKMLEPLQKVFKQIIFEALGNLIQRVISQQHTTNSEQLWSWIRKFTSFQWPAF